MANKSTCRSCGASIYWTTLPSGKKCPMDAEKQTSETIDISRIPVYEIEQEGNQLVATPLNKDLVRENGQEFHVSHFATCESREQHRKPQGGS